MKDALVDINRLLEPLPGDKPTGEDCGSSFMLQQLTTLADYLGAKAAQDELDQQASADFTGENAESDRRAAESFASDGRRQLEDLEKFAKEIIGKAPSPKEVRSQLIARAAEMLQATGKDLRVVQLLQLAWMSEFGLDGLLASLNLFSALLTEHGDALHPVPDEDDPGDYSARAFILSEMLSGSGAASILRQAGVFSTATANKFAVGDAETMDRAVAGEGVTAKLSVADVRALASTLVASEASVPADQLDQAVMALLGERLQLVESCVESAHLLVERFDAGSVQGGDKIVELLSRVKKVLGYVVGELAPPPAAAAGPGEARNSVAFAGAHQIQSGGALHSREDARRIILEICKFLEATEPGHPAPFFLRRAERLLGAKDFFVIMRDMAPDALSEIERITGHREPEQ